MQPVFDGQGRTIGIGFSMMAGLHGDGFHEKVCLSDAQCCLH